MSGGIGPGIDDADLDADSTETDTPVDVTEDTPAADPTDLTDAPDSEEAITVDSAEPELPQPFEPPDGGDPFSFRVDRTDVPIEGARVLDNWILLPKPAWDQQIRPNWLANRSEWRQREEGYKQQIAGLQQQAPQERAQAQAMLKELETLLSDKDKLIQWLDNFEQNAPMLRQQAENRLLKERLEVAEQAREQQEIVETAEELRPRLQEYLGVQVETALADPALKALAASPADRRVLVERLWRWHARNLFYEDAQGQVAFNHHDFADLLRDEAARAQHQAVTTKQVAAVAKKNAAAVGKPKGAPAVKSKTSAGAETNRPLSAEDWEERFEKKTYT